MTIPELVPDMIRVTLLWRMLVVDWLLCIVLVLQSKVEGALLKSTICVLGKLRSIDVLCMLVAGVLGMLTVDILGMVAAASCGQMGRFDYSAY